jgi:hypothetical protein
MKGNVEKTLQRALLVLAVSADLATLIGLALILITRFSG